MKLIVMLLIICTVRAYPGKLELPQVVQPEVAPSPTKLDSGSLLNFSPMFPLVSPSKLVDTTVISNITTVISNIASSVLATTGQWLDDYKFVGCGGSKPPNDLSDSGLRSCGTLSPGFVNSTEKHGVRCCRNSTIAITDGTADWRKKCSTTDDVYGASMFPQNSNPSKINKCHKTATFEEAQLICGEANGRLCTAEELDDGCAYATGCWLNDKLVWSEPSFHAETLVQRLFDLFDFDKSGVLDKEEVIDVLGMCSEFDVNISDWIDERLPGNSDKGLTRSEMIKENCESLAKTQGLIPWDELVDNALNGTYLYNDPIEVDEALCMYVALPALNTTWHGVFDLMWDRASDVFLVETGSAQIPLDAGLLINITNALLVPIVGKTLDSVLKDHPAAAALVVAYYPVVYKLLSVVGTSYSSYKASGNKISCGVTAIAQAAIDATSVGPPPQPYGLVGTLFDEISKIFA